MRWPLVYLVLCACSRVGFVAVDDTSGDGDGDVVFDADVSGMQRINAPFGDFYIDKYEASVTPDGSWGSVDQDQDNDGKIADPITATAHAVSHGLVYDDDGGEEAVVLTSKHAASAAGRLPATDVSFYQAAGACAHNGKRLCTAEEWLWSCQGGDAFTAYPYGSEFDGGDQAGVDCWSSNLSASVQLTGTASACVSPQGVYDLSGNAYEMVDAVDSTSGVIRGGAFFLDATYVQCGRDDVVTLTDNRPENGFRCCRDL